MSVCDRIYYEGMVFKYIKMFRTIFKDSKPVAF